MQKHVPLTITLLLCLCFTAAGQEPQSDKEKPAKIEVGIHFSALNISLFRSLKLNAETSSRWTSAEWSSFIRRGACSCDSMWEIRWSTNQTFHRSRLTHPNWAVESSTSSSLVPAFAFRFLNPGETDDAGPSGPSHERKIEVGGQFSSLGLGEFNYSLNPAMPNEPIFLRTNTQFGFGGRFTYNFVPSVAAEVQTDFYPEKVTPFAGGSAGGRILQVQAGAKIGKRFEKFGLFGKVRPGAVSFSEATIFDINAPSFFRIERRSFFSLDVGGVLEFYPSPRIVARFDGGDTMIRYGGAETGFLFNPPVNSPPAPYEFRHNFQFSAGVGFRF